LTLMRGMNLDAVNPFEIGNQTRPGGIPAQFLPRLFARRHKGRARIEQAVGKLKRFKRVALRCAKTKRNFAAIVSIAAAFILVKSVHTA